MSTTPFASLSPVGSSAAKSTDSNRDSNRDGNPDTTGRTSGNIRNDYLAKTPQGSYDHELADFLLELRDETGRRAKRAENLLVQRLADGGVQ